MPIVVTYDFSNRYGGTPVGQSKKEYHRLAPNAALTVSRVTGGAKAQPDTPCLQNKTQGFATVAGPYAFYDVIVTVSGFAQPFAGTTGAGKVQGGLTWEFTDNANNKLASGTTSPNNPPVPPGNVIPVMFSYGTRLQDSVRTFVGACSSAGGMTVMPGGPLSAYVQHLLVINFSLQFLLGWMRVGPGLAPVVPPAGLPTPPVGGANDSQPTEPQEWYHFLPGGFGLVPAADDFQDPALGQALAAHAFALDSKAVKASIAAIQATWTKDLKARKH